jgi:RNA-directed DNA polymerase
VGYTLFINMTKLSNTYQLKNLGLPPFQDLGEFSEEIRLSESLLKKYIGFGEFYYCTYEIPKKSGGSRLIAQPSRELKAIQGWILRNILDKLSSSEASKGFEINSSIYDNAFPHIGSNVILALDIDNFFPSIPANKVYGVFSSLGYPKNISSALTSLCVYKGFLPQGSPASPKLANLVCSHLDARIQGYAGKNGITYTRYADDITLSCQSIKTIEKARSFVQTIIKAEGFKVNKKKTRLLGLRKRKCVTGLILSGNKAGVGREIYRELRAKIHYLFTEKNDDFAHVNGWLAFVYGIDQGIYKKLATYIENITQKYPTSAAIGKIFIKT